MAVTLTGSRVPRIHLQSAGGHKLSGRTRLPQTQLERSAGKASVLRVSGGSAAAPKAGGSRRLFSSQDANWIALNSSLQCCSLADIFLLFKSSDFITHDLTQP